MIVKQHVEVVPLLLSQEYVNNPHSCQRTKTPTHIDCKLIWELTSKIRLSSADKLLPFTGNISKLLTSRSRVKDLSESSRKIQALVSFFLSLFFYVLFFFHIQGVKKSDSPRFRFQNVFLSYKSVIIIITTDSFANNSCFVKNPNGNSTHLIKREN